MSLLEVQTLLCNEVYERTIVQCDEEKHVTALWSQFAQSASVESLRSFLGSRETRDSFHDGRMGADRCDAACYQRVAAMQRFDDRCGHLIRRSKQASESIRKLSVL